MNVIEAKTPASDPEVYADLEAVLLHMASGTTLPSDIARRVEERSEKITAELRRKHGQLNVAVDLIREIRDEQ